MTSCVHCTSQVIFAHESCFPLYFNCVMQLTNIQRTRHIPVKMTFLSSIMFLSSYIEKDQYLYLQSVVACLASMTRNNYLKCHSIRQLCHYVDHEK